MFHMTLLTPDYRQNAFVIPEWSLADRLRKSRENAGLDQTELARVTGISRTSIVHYEAGRRSPRRPYLAVWSAATSVPIEWLETGKAPVGDDEGYWYTPRDSNPEPADYGFAPREASIDYGELKIPDSADELIEHWAIEARPRLDIRPASR